MFQMLKRGEMLIPENINRRAGYTLADFQGGRGHRWLEIAGVGGNI